MSKKILIGIFALILAGILLYQVPAVNRRLSWRIDFALTYLRGLAHPVTAMPTALVPPEPAPLPSPAAAAPTPAPQPPLQPSAAPSPTPLPSPTAAPTATPLPGKVTLPTPKFELQDINNCGPASLALYLRFYGWKGDQFAISDLIKPVREDRNVNIEELAYYTRNKTGWLRSEYRVNGSLDLLKRLIAAGIPVMIEESYRLEETFWVGDDHWAAHYLLLTGYDDAARTFVSQDTFVGADRPAAYDTLDRSWQAFNRVYFLLYLPEQEPLVRALLGKDWDADANRQGALAMAQQETQADPTNGFAWFNLGSNLVYFERYPEAAKAYDTARSLNLPQRMLRYQFGMFIAYFQAGRIDDLLATTEYALNRTPNAEEAMLWRGWALYRKGQRQEAAELWQKALRARPGYADARYALDFLSKN